MNFIFFCLYLDVLFLDVYSGLSCCFFHYVDRGPERTVSQTDNKLAGIISGALIFILVVVMTVVGVVIMKMVLSRRSKRKRMERVQLDILAV